MKIKIAIIFSALCGFLTFSDGAFAANFKCVDVFNHPVAEKIIFPEIPATDFSFQSHIMALLNEHHKTLFEARENGFIEADRLFAIDQAKASKRARPAPKMSSSTMRLLLRLYGANARVLDRGERDKDLLALERALESDPYLLWLVKEQALLPGEEAVHPMDHLLAELSGEYGVRLPLATALWSLRSVYDNRLSGRTQSHVAGLYDVHILLERLIHVKKQFDFSTNTVNGAVIPSHSWSYATSLAQAKESHKKILEGVRENAGHRFSRVHYERLKKWSHPGNSDIEVLYYYIMLKTGNKKIEDLSGMDKASLEAAVEEIRADISLPKEMEFDAHFFNVWHQIWRNNASYEVLLLRAFYEPTEGKRLERLLQSLDKIIVVGQNSESVEKFLSYLKESPR